MRNRLQVEWLFTDHPRFVEEVVDGLQRIDARNSAVVQCQDHVFPVVSGVAHVLPDQSEVRMKTSASTIAVTNLTTVSIITAEERTENSWLHFPGRYLVISYPVFSISIADVLSVT